MPRYEVTLRKITTELTTHVVEAKTEADADEMAAELVFNLEKERPGVKLPTLEWELDDESYEVDSLDKIDGDEDESDEEDDE